jgi:hypothetical protein
MDCRTFHKDLEDYLEDGLDFAGRFGMERHAQQCISCGKDMADAQKIRQMVSGLNRVQAPSNFEASVNNEICKRKLHSRAFGIGRFWNYAQDGLLWRNLAIASSGLAILVIGVFVSFQLAVPKQDSSSPVISEKPGEPYIERIGDYSTSAGTNPSPLVERTNENTIEVAKTPRQQGAPGLEFVSDREPSEAEYVEHLVVGADGQPMTIQLPMPRRIHFNYSQMSDEYFIQNVSH